MDRSPFSTHFALAQVRHLLKSLSASCCIWCCVCRIASREESGSLRRFCSCRESIAWLLQAFRFSMVEIVALIAGIKDLKLIQSSSF